MNNAIEIKNLQKKYPGVKALKGIDVEFPAGKISGLIGPNGSGKSTLLKIMAGLVQPDTGKINILKQNNYNHLMEDVAFLPEINHFYRWMKIKDVVRFYSEQYKDFSLEKVENLMGFMNLIYNQKIKNLSKGMVARLKLLLILARSAPLLIMDEPLAGIDPNSRARILESLIGEFNSDEQTIIMATHEIIEAEKFFDHVVFLENGRVVLFGNADDLRAERSKSLNGIVREVFK